MFLKSAVSKILLFGVLVGAGAAFYKGAKEFSRGKRIKEVIEQANLESQKMQQDNKELKERIDYFQSEAFKERTAKEKFNLQKEGERVVIIRPSLSQEDIPRDRDGLAEEGNFSAPAVANWKKWWGLFFDYTTK